MIVGRSGATQDDLGIFVHDRKNCIEDLFASIVIVNVNSLGTGFIDEDSELVDVNFPGLGIFGLTVVDAIDRSQIFDKVDFLAVPNNSNDLVAFMFGNLGHVRASGSGC